MMARLKNPFYLTAFALSTLLLTQCASPTPSPTATPLPQVEEDEADPTATTAPEPSETPEIVTTRGWTTHASTRTELKFEHPGEWVGPAEMLGREGVYVKDPDQSIGLILTYELAGNSEQMLANWATEDIEVIGVLTMAVEEVSDALPVIISRLEVPSKTATGSGITAQAAYVPRADDVLEVVWFGPTEQWDALAETFERMLSSLELWVKGGSPVGLQMVYLHDWAAPTAPYEGDGIWFASTSGNMGLSIRVFEIADPAALLNDWQPDALAAIGLTNCSVAASDERLTVVGGEWEAKAGECSADFGDATYQIAYAPNKDRVLEVIIYAPTDAWQYAQGIFSTMLGLMVDLR